MDKIIILTGPTGVGKSSYSISLAEKLNSEIISADSFQIYKGLNIGTAKVRPDESRGIRHHNIDIVEADTQYNVALFQRRTEDIIDDMISRNMIPIIVGGTGLYINSLIYDLDFSGDKSDESTRQALEKEVKDYGLDYLYKKLLTLDPAAEAYVNKGNRHRIIRAFEIYLNSGKLPSKSLNKFRKARKKYKFLYIILNQNREKLYQQINQRVEQMMDDGLLEEIKRLLKKGYDFNLRSFKAIGYREFEPYFQGQSSLDSVVDKIKQHSRNYAKRQLTWFRRQEDAVWFNKDDYANDDDCLEDIISLCEEFING